MEKYLFFFPFPFYIASPIESILFFLFYRLFADMLPRDVTDRFVRRAEISWRIFCVTSRMFAVNIYIFFSFLRVEALRWRYSMHIVCDEGNGTRGVRTRLSFSS